MRVCSVKFSNYGATYPYFIPDYIPNISIGDSVVVGDVGGDLKIVKVVSLDTDAHKVTNAIVQKIDLTDYYTHVAKIKKKSDLIKRLEELESQQNEFLRFEALARTNPEARALLEELRNL